VLSPVRAQFSYTFISTINMNLKIISKVLLLIIDNIRKLFLISVHILTQLLQVLLRRIITQQSVTSRPHLWNFEMWRDLLRHFTRAAKLSRVMAFGLLCALRVLFWIVSLSWVRFLAFVLVESFAKFIRFFSYFLATVLWMMAATLELIHATKNQFKVFMRSKLVVGMRPGHTFGILS